MVRYWKINADLQISFQISNYNQIAICVIIVVIMDDGVGGAPPTRTLPAGRSSAGGKSLVAGWLLPPRYIDTVWYLILLRFVWEATTSLPLITTDTYSKTSCSL